jgi:hypothetical protein
MCLTDFVFDRDTREHFWAVDCPHRPVGRVFGARETADWDRQTDLAELLEGPPTLEQLKAWMHSEEACGQAA